MMNPIRSGSQPGTPKTQSSQLPSIVDFQQGSPAPGPLPPVGSASRSKSPAVTPKPEAFTSPVKTHAKKSSMGSVLNPINGSGPESANPAAAVSAPGTPSTKKVSDLANITEPVRSGSAAPLSTIPLPSPDPGANGTASGLKRLPNWEEDKERSESYKKVASEGSASGSLPSIQSLTTPSSESAPAVSEAPEAPEPKAPEPVEAPQRQVKEDSDYDDDEDEAEEKKNSAVEPAKDETEKKANGVADKPEDSAAPQEPKQNGEHEEASAGKGTDGDKASGSPKAESKVLAESAAAVTS